MSRSPTLLAAYGALVLVLAACSTPRKALERDCLRAQRKLAKAEVRAAQLCPTALVRDSAYLPADSLQKTVHWSDSVNVDSVLDACADYAAAVTLERDSLLLAGTKVVERVVRRPSTPALRQLQDVACKWEAFEVENDRVKIKIRPGDREPLVTIHNKEMKVACPPVVKPPDCPPPGVASWYRTFTWVVIIAIILCAVGVVIFSLRHMAGPIVLVLLSFSTSANAQDWTRTETERREGERRLVIGGLFTGADSVYMQVYHDGDELLDEMVYGTWHLELGAYSTYDIKFTDTLGRVKRISLHELSDDMIEFYPAIEVDFERQGNIVLLKPTNGKPDWIEYDVGLGRKRK